MCRCFSRNQGPSTGAPPVDFAKKAAYPAFSNSVRQLVSKGPRTLASYDQNVDIQGRPELDPPESMLVQTTPPNSDTTVVPSWQGGHQLHRLGAARQHETYILPYSTRL